MPSDDTLAAYIDQFVIDHTCSWSEELLTHMSIPVINLCGACGGPLDDNAARFMRDEDRELIERQKLLDAVADGVREMLTIRDQLMAHMSQGRLNPVRYDELTAAQFDATNRTKAALRRYDAKYPRPVAVPAGG